MVIILEQIHLKKIKMGSPAAKDLAAHLVAIHDELAFQLYEAQDCYKDYADHNRKLHPNFHIGDRL
jgi:hypothetical protein